MGPFYSHKQYMIDRYGQSLFRVPVQIAGSCPHGRCAFCAEHGARAQQTQQADTLLEQMEAAVRFARVRYGAKQFMLYVQAFTTDLTAPEQQSLILQCLDRAKVEVVSIGTRPDCLPEAALDFLDHLAEQVEVWVEPGIQSTCDATLQRIQRGHDWSCGRDAILRLAGRGVRVAPHVILGLPGETQTEWNRTAEELAALPLAGIKIHNLHVIRGTALAEAFARRPFPVLNHWEYGEALMAFLRRMPPDIPVLRLCTDTPDEELIAPHWPVTKGQFADYLIRQMMSREVRQGDLFPAGAPRSETIRQAAYDPVPTGDGSITFYNPVFKEHYHAPVGARTEAEWKFVRPAKLAERLQQGPVRVLDVCFGLGNNSFAAWCAAAGLKNEQALEIIALEADRRVVRAAAIFFRVEPEDPVNWREVLRALLERGHFQTPSAVLDIRWGDARWTVQALESQAYDVVFLDAFSTQRNSELWTVDFFRQLRRVLRQDGVLLTYCAALPVRAGLMEAGFAVGVTEPIGRQRGGTIAALDPARIDQPLPPEELAAMAEGTRGMPYRDAELCASNSEILRNRQEVVLRAKKQ